MDGEMTGRPAKDMESVVASEAPPLEPPTTPDGRGMTELAAGFAIAFLALVGFAFVAGHLADQEAVALDASASPLIHSVSSPALDVVLTGVTDLGSVPVLGLFSVIVVAVLVFRRYRARALFLVVAIGGSLALNGMLKVTVHRPRPALSWAHVLPDYSFPSGHTMDSVVFYLAVALIVWVTIGRRIGALAVILALAVAIAVGLSRIYLGYHYLSDVVGGLAAGLAWLFVVALAFETIPPTWARRHRPPRDGGSAT